MKQLDRQTLRALVRGVASTLPHEIGCDDCFEHLDRFAEMTLAGKEPDEAMRPVKEHLARCGNCREEFEALLGT